MNNDFRKGLSSEEVQILRKEGKVNKSKKVKGKSHFKIIFESFFTSFNIVLYLLAFTFLMFQIFNPDGIRSIPITKYGFLTTILFNALTSIIFQLLRLNPYNFYQFYYLFLLKSIYFC